MNLLVIVSRDYGELGSALYFLSGLGSGVNVTLLVPNQMVESIDSSNASTSVGYDSLADIVDVLDETHPSAVLMFSAYLMMVGEKLSIFRLWKLLRLIRTKGIPMATSDPFTGMLKSPMSISLSAIMAARKTGLAKVIAKGFAQIIQVRLFLISVSLRSILHLYPVPIAKKHMPVGHRYLSFFSGNPSELSVNQSSRGNEEKFWVFILSDVDYKLQMNNSNGMFISFFYERIQEVVLLEKKPVIIGPKEMIKRLTGLGLSEPDVDMLSGIPFNQYIDVLVNAEFAFFWNYFSFSIVNRVLKQRPIFFFDEGHVIKYLTRKRSVSMDIFYCGWIPPLLAIDKSLDNVLLNNMTREASDHYAAIYTSMQKGMSPSNVLEHLRLSGGD